ncbi:urease accessory protein UreD [Dyadobacter sp. CY312]|uniref:urease accessory protein UreD n=1 Tax=Dyadobacter sp. CY312 TaxID=2907303 RepID=UPI001F1DA270|nr:urease accessory protein UreD [Dyadobacter sp. CY312]MCE7042660.1 urease accessory protein UreD [Dyadobacter sp. CY312]
MKKSYFSPPFKLADITENRMERCLHVMQMSSSPGILDGDAYEIRIEIGEGGHLLFQTQSYQRLFSMKTGASQSMTVVMEKGSSFVYLPHPVVPQANSIFTTRNKIHLASGCRLVWGEIVTCGRKLNGEVFMYEKYHAVTEVVYDGKLIIKENICLTPASIALSGIGLLEGFSHQASLMLLNEKFDQSVVVLRATEYLEKQDNIIFGITAAPVSGLLVRILGNRSEQLMDCLKSIANIFMKEN